MGGWTVSIQWYRVSNARNNAGLAMPMHPALPSLSPIWNALSQLPCVPSRLLSVVAGISLGNDPSPRLPYTEPGGSFVNCIVAID